MPVKKMYLVWHLETGNKFTVWAGTERAALVRFVAQKGPPPGEHFRVKERAEQGQPGSGGEWHEFSTSKTGIRKQRLGAFKPGGAPRKPTNEIVQVADDEDEDEGFEEEEDEEDDEDDEGEEDDEEDE